MLQRWSSVLKWNPSGRAGVSFNLMIGWIGTFDLFPLVCFEGGSFVPFSVEAGWGAPPLFLFGLVVSIQGCDGLG